MVEFLNVADVAYRVIAHNDYPARISNNQRFALDDSGRLWTLAESRMVWATVAWIVPETDRAQADEKPVTAFCVCSWTNVCRGAAHALIAIDAHDDDCHPYILE